MNSEYQPVPSSSTMNDLHEMGRSGAVAGAALLFRASGMVT